MSAVALAVGVASGALTLPRQLFAGAGRLPGRGTSRDGIAAPGGGAVTIAVVAGTLLAWRGPVAVAVGAVLLAVGRHHISRWRQRSADRRLVEALPNLLHDLARRLHAGYSAPLAFAEVLGQLSPDQPGRDGAALLAQGEPLIVVVSKWRNDLARRVGPTVLDELVGVVAMADASFGLRPSAVEVLADLATERQALIQEVGAQASQAKASAVVMTIAPLIFSAQMVLTDPAASRLLLGTSLGWSLIGIGVTLDALAWLWIRRLTGGHRSTKLSTGDRRFGDRRFGGRHSAAQLLVRRIVVGRPLPDRRLRVLLGPAIDRKRSRLSLETVGAHVETIAALFLGAIVGPVVSRSALGVFGPSTVLRRRRIGLATFVLPPLLILRPVLGVGAVAVVVLGPRVHLRSVKRNAAKQRSREVASVIELVRLALESGSTPSLALLSVGPLAGHGLRPSLSVAGEEIRRGVAFDAVLRRLSVEAPELSALSDVLVASNRLGLRVADTLRSLAVEARSARRREAETAARRLPVVLLFPVVCLTLPAFIVLTVAPLLLSGLGALHF